MRFLASAIAILLFVMFVLVNVLGGLVGSVWLIVAGHWEAVVLGMAAIWILPHAFTWLLFVPSLPFMFGAEFFLKRGHSMIAMIVGFPVTVAMQLFIGSWVFMVFRVYAANITDEGLVLPVLLCSYTVSIWPLATMAKHESDDAVATNLGLWNAFLSCLVMTISVLTDTLPLYASIAVCAITLTASLLVLVIAGPQLRAIGRQKQLDRMIARWAKEESG